MGECQGGGEREAGHAGVFLTLLNPHAIVFHLPPHQPKSLPLGSAYQRGPQLQNCMLSTKKYEAVLAELEEMFIAPF